MCIKCFIFVYMCCCAAAGSAGKPSVHLIVLVNGKSVRDEGKNSIATVNYALKDRLSFSCDYQDEKKSDGFGEQIVHQWSTSSISVNQSVFNFTYNIDGDDVDHESEVYCIKKIWNNALTNTSITSDPVKLIRSGRSVYNSIRTINYNENNPATHNCRKLGANQANILTRKIVNGSVYNVSEVEEVPLTRADSGLILYCETMHSKYIESSNKVEYTREIFGTTKYEYYSNVMSLYIQIGIGVAVFAVVCIVLVAGILLYRNKRRPPDSASTQHIYAELTLPESQAPRNLSQNREEPPYVVIIGFLRADETNNTTASVT